jgi:hypothetical protein
MPGRQHPRSRALSACVSVPAVLSDMTVPLSPQPVTGAARSAAALAVLRVIVTAPVVAVLPVVPALAAGPSTTMAGGPALLTRRDLPGILGS